MQHEKPPSSYPLRSQNRPVSSTTTATHSTITPLPLIHPGRYPYPPHTQSTHDQSTDTIDLDSDDHHFPRSETPSSSTRRKLTFHSLFGISLTRRSSSSISTPYRSPERKDSTSTSTSEPRRTSSRKRSFKFISRPSTPKSVDAASAQKSPYSIPVPSSPLPLSASPRRRSFGLTGSQRSTPKSSTGHLPLPLPQTSPAARSHGRRHSLGSERAPHDSAVALPEEPSHRTVPKPGHVLPDGSGRNKGKEREKLLADSHSQSLPDDLSPISRNYLFAGHPLSSRLPTVDSASSDENEQPSTLAPHRLPMIPRITHTPPTPQRPGGEVDSTAVGPGKVELAKGRKTATVPHREQVLVSNSQSLPDPQHALSTKARFAPRFFSGKDPSRTKDGGAQKSTKRPPIGSSNGLTHKTPGSNTTGPARNMTNHRSKLGSFDFERPVSALNKSSSTVDRQGTRVPGDSSSYSKTRLERTISEDSARGDKSRLITPATGQAELPALPRPDHTGDTSVVSFSSISVQTRSTGKGTGSNTPAEPSSSWGRASGRRVLRGSHGTFAFDHPSSLPGSPNPQAFSLPTEPTGLPGHASSPHPQSTTLSHTAHVRGQSYNTSDPVESGYSKPGERRPKGKGRSLDLGLGLSWAPSRVREDVLMPGFILAREKAKLEKSKASGSDVTKMFESLLSESQFQTFKKHVHRFDAHVIPLEGPFGLLARVEKLLAESGLSEQERNGLMAEFAVFVENHSG